MFDLQSHISSVDEMMSLWEQKLASLSVKSSTVDAFLDLAVHDMKNAAANIDCPYCRKHMLLEADEIAQVLIRLRSEGDVVHTHGLGERLHTLSKSFAIIVNVLLGGLRRARII